MAKRKPIFEEGATGAQKVAAFLSKAGVFYLGTTDGDQPRIRALSWFDYLEDEDRVIFAIGTFKNVYKQMHENPKVEIFALVGGYFIRYDGSAVFFKDEERKQQVWRQSPGIGKIYRENGWDGEFFYLENAHAEVRYSLDPVEEFDV